MFKLDPEKMACERKRKVCVIIDGLIGGSGALLYQLLPQVFFFLSLSLFRYHADLYKVPKKCAVAIDRYLPTSKYVHMHTIVIISDCIRITVANYDVGCPLTSQLSQLRSYLSQSRVRLSAIGSHSSSYHLCISAATILSTTLALLAARKSGLDSCSCDMYKQTDRQTARA